MPMSIGLKSPGRKLRNETLRKKEKPRAVTHRPRPTLKHRNSATYLLQLLEKLTSRARDINPAWDAPLAVFHSLYNPRWLAALGAIRALGSIHDLLAVSCLCNLCAYCHGSFLLTL